MKKILIFFAIILVITIVGIIIYYPKKNNNIFYPTPQLPIQEGLPAQVEVKRQAIYNAAYEKNYGKLAQEAEPVFNYSFGGSEEGGFIAHLKNNRGNQNGEIFNIITSLLELPYGKQGNIYSWPSVFIKEPKDWTEGDIVQMKTFLTDTEIESYREFGGYAYYRLGITEEGKWTYFIAGD